MTRTSSFLPLNEKLDVRAVTRGKERRNLRLSNLGFREARTARYFAPRVRLIATAEISLPGDCIEIVCWVPCVTTASS